MDSNNFNSDIFINLPHYILRNIIDNIKSNVDRITFVLVCKKWFHLIDKILSFKINDVVLGCFNNFIKNKPNAFKSFRNVVERSLHSKKEIVLFLGTEFNVLDPYDYEVIIGNESDLNNYDIPLSVNSLWFESYTTHLDYKSVMLWLEKYKHVKKVSVNIPPVNTFFIPNHIKIFEGNFDTRYSISSKTHFHEGLESLVMEVDRCDLDNEKTSSTSTVFPSSLKELRISGNTFNAYDQLPPNLELLSIRSNPNEPSPIKINITSFPYTLKRIHIGSFWVNQLRDLPHLSSISLEEDNELYIKSASEFPLTLTSLDFKNNSYPIPGGLIPISVRYLYLGKCKYSLSAQANHGVPFFKENAEFEELDLGYNVPREIGVGDLPKVVKKLYMIKLGSPKPSFVSPEAVPQGLVKMELKLPQKSLKGYLPDTLKKLVVKFRADRFFYEDELPDTIEALKIFQFKGMKKTFQSKKISFPSSIKKVHINVFSRIDPSNFIKIFPKTVTRITIFGRLQKNLYKRLDDKHFLVIGYEQNFNIGIFTLK